ncbi:MAG: prohibitin family protein [Desulfobacterales bacterium]|nr:prohibitin family protein [Desulfobacterales bacterium]
MGENYEKISTEFKDKLPFIIIFVLIFLFVFAYLYNNIVITIGPGQAGVKYRRFFGGTVVDRVFPEGIRLIFPWDKMYIYNVRVQEAPHEFNVLTRNGMTVHLSISIRYLPEYRMLGRLHKEVGPDYVKTVVIPEIENVFRVIIGRHDAEQVYTTDPAILSRQLVAAKERIMRRFINIDNVIIKRIELPQKLKVAIQNKLEQKHIAEAYKFRLEREQKEAERKAIEARGIEKFNRTVDSSLSENVLRWMGVKATLELSTSKNAKVVVIGSGKQGLPVIGNIPLEEPDVLNGPAPEAAGVEEAAPVEPPG